MAKDKTKDNKFIGGIVLSLIAGILFIFSGVFNIGTWGGWSLTQLSEGIFSGVFIIFGSIVSYKMNRLIGSIVILLFSLFSILIPTFASSGFISILGIIGGILIFLTRK